MPTYEYECESCAHRFEAAQKMSDAPLTDCPKCGKHIRRVLSAEIGISFKGSGFYATDSQKKKNAAKSAGKKDEKPASGEKAPACPAACPNCPAAARSA